MTLSALEQGDERLLPKLQRGLDFRQGRDGIWAYDISWPILWGEVVNGTGPVSLYGCHCLGPFQLCVVLMSPTHLLRDLLDGPSPFAEDIANRLCPFIMWCGACPRWPRPICWRITQTGLAHSPRHGVDGLGLSGYNGRKKENITKNYFFGVADNILPKRRNRFCSIFIGHPNIAAVKSQEHYLPFFFHTKNLRSSNIRIVHAVTTTVPLEGNIKKSKHRTTTTISVFVRNKIGKQKNP